MRVFTSLLLAVSSAFAYQVTYPGGDQGWTTSGPNYLKWERVDTDPLNFTAVLTNVVSPRLPTSSMLPRRIRKNRIQAMMKFWIPSLTEHLEAICVAHQVEAGQRVLASV